MLVNFEQIVVFAGDAIDIVVFTQLLDLAMLHSTHR